MNCLIFVGFRIEIKSLLFMHQSLICFLHDNQIVGVYKFMTEKCPLKTKRNKIIMSYLVTIIDRI